MIFKIPKNLLKKSIPQAKQTAENLINLDSKSNTDNSLIQQPGNLPEIKQNPLSMLNEEEKNLAIKYKIYEDSTKEVIEELKDKVPEISDHLEFKKWVESVIEEGKQEEVLNEHGILILTKKTDILFKNKIDPHHFFKFQDRNYEVDIQHELTKDLFEKQRVIDKYVEENKEKLNYLIGYYQNKYKYLNLNKYSYLVYENAYKMDKIKYQLIGQTTLTSLLSYLFFMHNPYLLFLLVPEYFTMVKSYLFLSNVVEKIFLESDKQHVIISKYNFLGFKREARTNNTTPIREIQYAGTFKNKTINNKDKGFLYIFRRMWRYINPHIFDKNKKEVDNFERFHEIKIDDMKSYFISCDCSKESPNTDENLTLHILNNELDKILKYDYSSFEKDEDYLKEQFTNYLKEQALKKHKSFVTEEERLKRQYMNYIPNRDFSKNHEDIAKIDKTNGEYIDNGYR